MSEAGEYDWGDERDWSPRKRKGDAMRNLKKMAADQLVSARRKRAVPAKRQVGTVHVQPHVGTKYQVADPLSLTANQFELGRLVRRIQVAAFWDELGKDWGLAGTTAVDAPTFMRKVRDILTHAGLGPVKRKKTRGKKVAA